MAPMDLFLEYQTFVASKIKPGEVILAQMTPQRAALGHAAHGIATEAGELCDVIKKHVDYGQELDVDHLVEETGDLLFYLTDVLTKAGVSLDSVLMGNMAKLNRRYKARYTDNEAAVRADKA